jgi:hypothetical protein
MAHRDMRESGSGADSNDHQHPKHPVTNTVAKSGRGADFAEQQARRVVTKRPNVVLHGSHTCSTHERSVIAITTNALAAVARTYCVDPASQRYGEDPCAVSTHLPNAPEVSCALCAITAELSSEAATLAYPGHHLAKGMTNAGATAFNTHWLFLADRL